MSDTEAIIRLPLIFQVDSCVNTIMSDFYNYHFIPSVVQEIFAVPVILILLVCTCILITWRNNYLLAYYSSVISFLCILFSFETCLKFLNIVSESVSSKNESGDLIWHWSQTVLILLFSGCFLTASYIVNPFLGVKYCPVWFFLVYMPTFLFIFLPSWAQIISLVLFFSVAPLAPVFILIKHEGSDYYRKARQLFNLSANTGHFEFLIGYLLANVDRNFVFNILILYWCCHQGYSTIPTLFDYITQYADNSGTRNEQSSLMHEQIPPTNENIHDENNHDFAVSPASEIEIVTIKLVFRSFVLNCTKSWALIASTSAVLTRVAKLLDRVLSFLLETRNEEEDFGTFCALLYLIASIQSHLAYLTPDEQYSRFLKNCLIMLVGILHFSHMSSQSVVEAMGATNNRRPIRHIKIYILIIVELITAFSVINYVLSFPIKTWNIAVSLFTAEIIFKVSMLIVIYLFFYTWDSLPLKKYINQDFDDMLTNIKLFTSCILFIFGCAVFINGCCILIFDAGGKFRAVLLGLHAYSTIFLQCRDGYRKFQLRRSASKKLEQLEIVEFMASENGSTDSSDEQNNEPNLCPICYESLEVALKTKCGHVFHKNCLRKWIYVQNYCPLCKVNFEE